MTAGMAALLASAFVAVVAIVAGIAVLIIGLYFLVQFIKWAWLH